MQDWKVCYQSCRIWRCKECWPTPPLPTVWIRVCQRHWLWIRPPDNVTDISAKAGHSAPRTHWPAEPDYVVRARSPINSNQAENGTALFSFFFLFLTSETRLLALWKKIKTHKRLIWRMLILIRQYETCANLSFLRSPKPLHKLQGNKQISFHSSHRLYVCHVFVCCWKMFSLKTCTFFFFFFFFVVSN